MFTSPMGITPKSGSYLPAIALRQWRPDAQRLPISLPLVARPWIPCPDLVIIDLNLPRRSGVEVLAHMRHSPRCGSVPVAILTSSDTEHDRAQARQMGASAYLRKPLRLDEFLQLGAVFKSILDEHRDA